ncbi:hypothetical protein [Bacillus salacetis]|uniref:hypothetical protein n=1 Tax=Bacillus salacetis TaxID=2315464 RepID=UPI001443D2FD|nr:hypothetical protein [Bacillus salacetis]
MIDSLFFLCLEVNTDISFGHPGPAVREADGIRIRRFIWKDSLYVRNMKLLVPFIHF